MEIKINEAEINDNKLTINLTEIFHAIAEQVNPDDLWQVIESLGWNKDLYKRTVEVLMKTFSRQNYNEFIHVSREEFLKSLKLEEIKFYADKLARLMEERIRKSEDYFKLYHHFREIYGWNAVKNHPEPANIDFKMKKELAEMIKKAFEKEKS